MKKIVIVLAFVTGLMALTITAWADSSNYVQANKKLILIKKAYVYKSTKFKANQKISELKVNSKIKANAIEYSAGKTPRLKVKRGYITANKKYFISANSSKLKHYLLPNIQKQIITSKSVNVYKDVSFKKVSRKYSASKVLTVKAISWSDGKTPRLKVTGGYISANKNIVKIYAKKNYGVNMRFADATVEQKFIAKHANEVIKATNKYGLYASVQMAQAALESAWGTSLLTLQANNFFGVKGSYNGQFVKIKTAEHSKNKGWYYVKARFRKYPTAEASFMDNAKKLHDGPSFDANYYAGSWKKNAKTYKQAANALVNRYATDPNYGKKLIKLIEKYDLHRLLD